MSAEQELELSPERRTTNLATGVALVTFAGLLSVPGLEVAVHGPQRSVVALAILLAFVASERLVFHIESRNEAVSFSPADVPLALGLVLLSPVTLVAVRLVGGAAGLLIWRKQPLFKFVTNLTSFTVEVVVATLVFRLLLGVHPTPSLGMWLALVVAMLFALIAGGVLIASAIAFFEHDFNERVRREFTHSYLFYLPGALLGASAAVPLLVEPWMIAVGLVPAPVIWLVLRSHGSLMHRFSDLAHIHEFSSQVGRSAHLEDIVEIAVVEISDHLRASTVELVIWRRDGAKLAQAGIGESGIVEQLPLRRMDDTVPAGRPVPIRPGDEGPIAEHLRACGIDEAIVVAIRHDGCVVATLLVAHRVGASRAFSDDDCDRLVPISQQLAVALAKGQLHLEIQHQATHDALTGLPNRAYFEAYAGQCVREQDDLALLLLDLDRFKEVNDTLGHHVGDQLLVVAAERIAGCLAPGDTLARLGGDEFAVLSPGTELDEASLLAETISVALEEPFRLTDATVAIAASIGLVVAPGHGRDHESLLRRADLAMYEAKRMHSRCVAFVPELEGTDSMRLALLGELRDAIRGDRLSVHYQPKIGVTDGEVVGVEALVRWNCPGHGPVGPDVFVPMAEQAGLIGELTGHVLSKAIAEAAGWLANGWPIGLAVNISPQSLLDEDLPEEIAQHLAWNLYPPELLTLEITEDSVMSDAPRVWSILERLDQLGVRISVDDFGTGHSSLVNLRRMPVCEVKIDRGFVTDLLLEHDDEVIVRSTVDLAHNLGLTVVAEGVETEEILSALGEMGCDIAQGYGISRPLAPEHLLTWLRGRMGSRTERPEIVRDLTA